MSEPWFSDPNTFGAWFGAIAGGGGGSLAGVLGALAGYLAPRGKGRQWILAGMWGFVVLGLILLGVGIVAVSTGQPYAIWYPFVLCGAIFTVVVSCNIPVVRGVYRRAEERKLEAEAIRRG